MKITTTITYFKKMVLEMVFEDKSNTYFFQINVCMLWMLYFNRIDFSEGTDVNKTSKSKQSDICHYWYLSFYGFKFQPNVWNGCNDIYEA